MSELDRADLRREIQFSFSGRVYPGDDHITRETSDESSEHHRVAQFFRGKSWHDVDYASLLAGDIDPSGFLYVLSPEAFAYFMPAFLREALDVNSAPELAETIHFALSAPSEVEMQSSVGKWKQDHMAPFDEQELTIIHKVYRYLDARLD
ncbi:MAG: hypothetical protein O7E57_16420 [Gammaproteobacteria bacterium]|nr:hypothetical protein [Gammaproteobacteria bacterium]